MSSHVAHGSKKFIVIHREAYGDISISSLSIGANICQIGENTVIVSHLIIRFTCNYLIWLLYLLVICEICVFFEKYTFIVIKYILITYIEVRLWSSTRVLCIIHISLGSFLFILGHRQKYLKTLGNCDDSDILTLFNE